MASDETMFDMDDANYEDDDDHHHHHPHNLSRLSVCTSSSKLSVSLPDDYDDDMSMYMSSLSIDADEEFSDEKEGKGVSSDSDKEVAGCQSLPVTPRIGYGYVKEVMGVKEYGSENEAERQLGGKTRNKLRRRMGSERWVERAWEEKKKKETALDEEMGYVNHNSSTQGHLSGENECVVIMRPKGGRRSLCMDLDEVKACRDLGFELENEMMFEIPSRISISGSTIDTSSGGNSPIANWRISSPGDDPRDVKARLKIWAQAVALVSASHTP